jgi:long-chain fatty acid transport protein
MTSVRVSGLLGLTFAVGAMGWAVPGQATEGYFQHGFGARQKALGGAGAADSRDATATALNPAGLVHVGNEASIAASIFSPRREFEGGGGPGFSPNGLVESDSNYFVIPNLAASYRLAPNPLVDVIGFSVYGSGGMNTDYPNVSRAPAPDGVFFGNGRTGVNLQQALISVALAKAFGPVAIGVAPIVARQQFEAEGLQAIIGGGNVTDVAWGFGVRGGVEWSLLPGVRVGVAGNTRIWSEEFDKYSGLFAERGGFDIPASVQAGLAYDVTRNITLLADYRHIWFGSIASIANPSTNPPPFGADNGPGFGWNDVDVVKFGVEWRSSPDLTLRAGYSYATGAIDSRDVELNILAPAVVHHHITGGFEYRLGQAWSVEFAGLYAPEGSVSGLGQAFGPDPHTVEIRMEQYEATIGFKYKFGEPAAPLK